MELTAFSYVYFWSPDRSDNTLTFSQVRLKIGDLSLKHVLHRCSRAKTRVQEAGTNIHFDGEARGWLKSISEEHSDKKEIAPKNIFLRTRESKEKIFTNSDDCKFIWNGKMKKKHCSGKVEWECIFLNQGNIYAFGKERRFCKFLF